MAIDDIGTITPDIMIPQYLDDDGLTVYHNKLKAALAKKANVSDLNKYLTEETANEKYALKGEGGIAATYEDMPESIFNKFSNIDWYGDIGEQYSEVLTDEEANYIVEKAQQNIALKMTILGISWFLIPSGITQEYIVYHDPYRDMGVTDSRAEIAFFTEAKQFSFIYSINDSDDALTEIPDGGVTEEKLSADLKETINNIKDHTLGIVSPSSDGYYYLDVGQLYQIHIKNNSDNTSHSTNVEVISPNPEGGTRGYHLMPEFDASRSYINVKVLGFEDVYSDTVDGVRKYWTRLVYELDSETQEFSGPNPSTYVPTISSIKVSGAKAVYKASGMIVNGQIILENTDGTHNHDDKYALKTHSHAEYITETTANTKYADKTHTHTEYADKTHSHTDVNGYYPFQSASVFESTLKFTRTNGTTVSVTLPSGVDSSACEDLPADAISSLLSAIVSESGIGSTVSDATNDFLIENFKDNIPIRGTTTYDEYTCDLILTPGIADIRNASWTSGYLYYTGLFDNNSIRYDIDNKCFVIQRYSINRIVEVSSDIVAKAYANEQLTDYEFNLFTGDPFTIYKVDTSALDNHNSCMYFTLSYNADGTMRTYASFNGLYAFAIDLGTKTITVINDNDAIYTRLNDLDERVSSIESSNLYMHTVTISQISTSTSTCSIVFTIINKSATELTAASIYNKYGSKAFQTSGYMPGTTNAVSKLAFTSTTQARFVYGSGPSTGVATITTLSDTVIPIE